ncbi:DNA polymerase III subunit chi [Thermodesulforhabdus norvegica]|uniref:DNA polymerase III, chi subunit n=1 Tax=Thermodesulforhabdus norvegica TaxID=39841 RepID=A0A1I4V0W5_9BACT|nr:DNA polymerase III subunit chi [Thermodesulforhabdus norvegica]SFM94828.1 DNA polymerase III, chi subunit [Thermodesulforhabdus norvegica]
MKRALFFETSTRDRDGDICRISEALCLAGCRVLIFVESTMEAAHFDDFLWTFNKESFVPHRIVSAGENLNGVMEKVFIGMEEVLFPEVDAVVCGGKADLEALLKAHTVAFPVIMDDERKRQESRSLWKRLQRQGIFLHHLPASEKKEWGSRVREVLERRDDG